MIAGRPFYVWSVEGPRFRGIYLNSFTRGGSNAVVHQPRVLPRKGAFEIVKQLLALLFLPHIVALNAGRCEKAKPEKFFNR